MGERHRPTITRTVADLGEGEGWVYQLRCTCPSLVFDTYHAHRAEEHRRRHLDTFEPAPNDQPALFDL